MMCDIDGLIDNLICEAIYDYQENTPLSRGYLSRAKKEVVDYLKSEDELVNGYEDKIKDVKNELVDQRFENENLKKENDTLRELLETESEK
jgi:hypothetical protein